MTILRNIGIVFAVLVLMLLGVVVVSDNVVLADVIPLGLVVALMAVFAPLILIYRRRGQRFHRIIAGDGADRHVPYRYVFIAIGCLLTFFTVAALARDNVT